VSARPSLAARLAQVAEPAAPAPAFASAVSPPISEVSPTARTPKTARAARPDTPQRNASIAEVAPTAPVQAKARAGKIMVAGYFTQEMARAVKLLAVERGVTVQSLIGEGLDLILRKAGKHPMGER
jgi:hypothetical protein